jgi:VIT1/CCC1 family predicted Fe2+/Mn2+ transporter
MDKERIIKAQKNEITEFHIYRHLAQHTKDSHNKKILEQISQDELGHYKLCKKITGRDVAPDRLKIFQYTTISRIFGLAFGLKLMERGEGLAVINYSDIEGFPDTKKMARDEKSHEDKILSMLSEERVEYAGSIVLGLNDALVELTGALAGLTFVISNTRVIASIGFVTGFAASLSMAASDYLSSIEEEHKGKNPLKSALYTGVTYILTVLLLISPYVFLNNIYIALASMLGIAMLIIFAYTFYITTAKSQGFKKRFLEMAAISLTVAFISFGVGYIIKSVFKVDV